MNYLSSQFISVIYYYWNLVSLSITLQFLYLNIFTNNYNDNDNDEL